MIEKALTLSVPGTENYLVRTIVEEDIELLRVWKNACRTSFFFKDIITPEMQRDWFKRYLERNSDFMMVIVSNGERIGCIGFRSLEDRVDLYNLIVGHPQSVGKGHMSLALDLICKEIKKRYPGRPIMVSVLRDNPALQWYFKRGFVVTAEKSAHFDLTLSI
jgi:hypothetical protein